MRELRALATLSKAAELGSLSSAAEEQGITPQAASKALMQLERQLGVKLLARTTRRLALTPEGQVLVDASRPALEAMTAALDAVRKVALAPLEGSLTISAPRSVVSTVLAPLVEAFSVLHPKLSLRIASLDEHAPMPAVDDEVTFSLGRPADESITVIPLLEVVFIHCASPGYLAKHGVPASVEALETRQAGRARPAQFPRKCGVSTMNPTARQAVSRSCPPTITSWRCRSSGRGGWPCSWPRWSRCPISTMAAWYRCRRWASARWSCPCATWPHRC